MNLFCLIAASAAFSRGKLARPGRLACAGAAFGVACAVKFWAVTPSAVLLAGCLIVADQRNRRTRAYLAGLVAGFVLPAAPFVLAAPATFIRSTLLDQASRMGTFVPPSLRLAHVTGLIDVLNWKGKLSLFSGAHPIFGRSVVARISAASVGWLPMAVTVILVAAIAAGYAVGRRRLSHLDWFSLASAVLASVLILSYSAFFYHYPAFPAPWIALAAGCAAVGAAGCPGLVGFPRLRRALVAVFAVVILGVAALELHEVAPLSRPTNAAAARLIPEGACVVTDETSLMISADRFTPLRPGCPDIIDSLATTLALSHGVSVQGGAAKSRHVVAAWQAILSRADYVWLSPGNARRIPWTPELTSWFQRNFRPVGRHEPVSGRLYVRVG